MKNKKTHIAENVLRQYIQKEIRKIMEADEESTEKEPKEKPKQEPSPAEEQGLNPDFQDALNTFVQKLKSGTESVEYDDIVEMVGNFIDRFVTSSEAKLNILKSVKSNIVR